MNHTDGPTRTFERWESQVRGYCRAYPAVFHTARNACQYDEQGRRYLDFFSGAGVLNFGHNHPEMKQALIDYIQADGVAHSLDFYTTAKRSFMQAFADRILVPRGMDGYRMQFTGPTGTNAVEAAMKLARRVTGRTTVAAFTHGFHGMTIGALEATANAKYRCAAGRPLGHVLRLPFDGYGGPEHDTLEVIRRALGDTSSGYETPAAFLVETIQAEGGVNVARAEWLRELQEIAREHGILLIIDDIQVGCGRTGAYFSFEGMGLEPDMVVLAKGIGGFGTPLAMVLIKEEHDVWEPGDHTGTFRGQDLSFIAGEVALRFFKDDAFLAEVREKASTQQTFLTDLVAEHAGRGVTLRGRGLIHGVDLGDPAWAKAVSARCFELGLILGTCGPQGRVLKPLPPLTIPEGELEEGLEILRSAMTDVGAGS